MPANIRNRHFLRLGDFSPEELRFLLRLSVDLKAAKYAGTEFPGLSGKNIALIFEKDSTRTRCAFEVAAFDQGAHVTYLGPTGSQIGHKETIKDTARVLGRMYDAIEYRGFGQEVAEELARFAGVPVFNGLTDEFHPTQVLADLLTMQEHATKPLAEVSFCFLGDCGCNTANSLMMGAAKMGMEVRLAGPAECHPTSERVEEARQVAGATGARITVTEDALEGVAGCDFLYTDVWVSMGQPAELWAERLESMLPYQVNAMLMGATGDPTTKFMHCLPAFHNTDTKIGREMGERYGLEALEVTEDVFESPASIVFDQAENRLHTIKAVLVAVLGG
jgi:ornithine carbamoyltransferase